MASRTNPNPHPKPNPHPHQDTEPKPSAAIREAAAAFGLAPASLASMGAFVSEVWSADRDDGPVVLKVMDPGHRSVAEALAEVDWQLALDEAGVPVARPLAASDGSYVVSLGSPPRLAVAYRRTPGRHLRPPDWTPELTRRHGRLLGRLQAHARAWDLPPGRSRPGWLDHATLERAPQAVPGDDAFLAAVAEIDERVRATVPSPQEHVGLVHADLHAWNVLVDDDGRLTAIDFDDAVIGPFLFDLAIPLYYAVTTRRDEDPATVADAFLTPYLEGFDEVAPRPPGDGDAVATLLAMRQADLAVAVHVEIPPERWNDELRSAAERLMRRTAARHEVVPREVLRRHFG